MTTTEVVITEVTAAEVTTPEVTAAEVPPPEVPATEVPATEVPAPEVLATGVPPRGLGWPDPAPRLPARSALGWPDENASGTSVQPTSAQPSEEPPAGPPGHVSRETTPGGTAASARAATKEVPEAADLSVSVSGPTSPELMGASNRGHAVDEGDAPHVPRETTVAAQAAPHGILTADDNLDRATSGVADVADQFPPVQPSPVQDAASRAHGDARIELPPPAHTRVLTVANQKGGVGKTTTTVNLAAALALHGAQVLVIDLDPQGNASTALGVDHHADVPSIYDVLVEGRPMSEVVTPAEGLPGLLCAPATIDLAGAEIELVSLVAREMRLQRALRAYEKWRAEQNAPRLDYVFIDCPPSLGLLTINALVAAPEVLIPIQCEYYALEGVGQLVNNVNLVKSHLNPDLHVSTIVLTMYDARTRLAAQVADEVRTHFAGVVLRTTIPRSVRISEAPSYGQTVITYDPASTGALSYLQAAREISLRGATDPEPKESGTHD